MLSTLLRRAVYTSCPCFLPPASHPWVPCFWNPPQTPAGSNAARSLLPEDLSSGLFLHHGRAVSSPSPARPGMLQRPRAQSNLSSSHGELLHTVPRATASPRPGLQPSDSADLRGPPPQEMPPDVKHVKTELIPSPEPCLPASGPAVPSARLTLATQALKIKRLSCFKTGPRAKMVTSSFVVIRISASLGSTNSGQAFVGAGGAECGEGQEPRRPESVTRQPRLRPGTVCRVGTVTSSSPASWADLQVR